MRGSANRTGRGGFFAAGFGVRGWVRDRGGEAGFRGGFWEGFCGGFELFLVVDVEDVFGADFWPDRPAGPGADFGEVFGADFGEVFGGGFGPAFGSFFAVAFGFRFEPGFELDAEARPVPVVVSGRRDCPAD